MKFLVGETPQGDAVFVVDGDSAVNITALDPAIGPDLQNIIAQPELIAAFGTKLGQSARVPVSSITPALPVATPSAIICVGLNYTDHIKEGGYDIPDYPALFMRSKASIMAAGQPMIRPTCSETLDYEAELMVVVGKGGRQISEEDALDHVFGYTVFNDGSVREYQRKTHQWTPGKNFDNTGAIGPFVVTPDEVPEGASGLKIESRVGDEILQSSDTANMIWGVRKIIAIVSGYTTLAPGDLIAMGTPPGVGHAKKPNPRWLKPGETVEVKIEGIGICASPIIDEKG